MKLSWTVVIAYQMYGNLFNSIRFRHFNYSPFIYQIATTFGRKRQHVFDIFMFVKVSRIPNIIYRISQHSKTIRPFNALIRYRITALQACKRIIKTRFIYTKSRTNPIKISNKYDSCFTNFLSV